MIVKQALFLGLRKCWSLQASVCLYCRLCLYGVALFCGICRGACLVALLGGMYRHVTVLVGDLPVFGGYLERVLDGDLPVCTGM